jgi:methionyl-tRNA formyltransferase
MDVVFLGVDNHGMRIYEWLCDRESVTVRALLTERTQLDLVADIKPDLLVSCGFDHRVPPEVLDVPPEGAVNLHPAYLPYNRGRNPNVWSIVNGTPAGVTIHYMDEEFDTGEIIARRRVETAFDDTGRSLQRCLEEAAVDLFRETWPEIESGTVETTPQPDDGSYHSGREFEELCELDPDATVEVKQFLDRLRALTYPPYDNARIDVDGEIYYVDIAIYREGHDASSRPENGLPK